jgi:hypothetical protein
VVVPGGLGGEIPDLRFQRANEFVCLAGGELFFFDDMLSDVREPAAQTD